MTNYRKFQESFNYAKRRANVPIMRTSAIQKIAVDNLTPQDIIRMRGVETYPDSLGFSTLYKPNPNISLYGMQIPQQFDRLSLMETIKYLMETRRIFSIVDLHDCLTTNILYHDRMGSRIGCNPYDPDCEKDIHEKVANALSIGNNAIYYRINGYMDMSPGTPEAWHKISQIKNTSEPENSVVVHCLAGFGRTGSVILYLLIRDTYNRDDIINRLSNPHFGYRDRLDFLTHLRTLLQYSPRHVKNEVLSTDTDVPGHTYTSVSRATLLRQRINRILFFLARECNVTNYYGYMPNQYAYYVNDIFVPYKFNVSWQSFNPRANFNYRNPSNYFV